jgi:hypothetical protein
MAWMRRERSTSKAARAGLNGTSCTTASTNTIAPTGSLPLRSTSSRASFASSAVASNLKTGRADCELIFVHLRVGAADREVPVDELRIQQGHEQVELDERGVAARRAGCSGAARRRWITSSEVAQAGACRSAAASRGAWRNKPRFPGGAAIRRPYFLLRLSG